MISSTAVMTLSGGVPPPTPQRFGYLGLFDVIGSPWRLRAVKPGPEYLTRLLAACGCNPGDALLVDDNRENTGCAAAFGLRVAHVTGPPAATLLLDAAAEHA